MKPYVVKQGEYLDGLAFQMRFDANEVWNDPNNADLKGKRSPNILHPGDVLYVPDNAPTDQGVDVGSGNGYSAGVPEVKLELIFWKSKDEPLADEPYTIQGLGDDITGQTDSKGTVSLSVPVNVKAVNVLFTNKNALYPVSIGAMDPIEEVTGVRKRLEHLGFYDALPDEGDDRDELAIRGFQSSFGLTVSGTMDDETKAALLKAHGS